MADLQQGHKQSLRCPGLFWICLEKAVLVSLDPSTQQNHQFLIGCWLCTLSMFSCSLLATTLTSEDYDLCCTYKKMGPEKSEATHTSPGIWTQAVWRLRA